MLRWPSSKEGGHRAKREGMEWFPKTKGYPTAPPSTGKYQQPSMAFGFIS
jgi:hypothetical protein